MLLVISPDRILMAVAWPYIKLFNLPLCLSTTFCDVVRFIFVGLKSPLMQAQFTYCRCMEINIYSSWLYQCCPKNFMQIHWVLFDLFCAQTNRETDKHWQKHSILGVHSTFDSLIHRDGRGGRCPGTSQDNNCQGHILFPVPTLTSLYTVFSSDVEV